MWNVLAPTLGPIIEKLIDKPFKLSIWGIGGGTGSMYLAKLAETEPSVTGYDQFIYRLGATGAALASVLSVVLLVYRIIQARKETLESKKPDKHD